MQMQCAAKKFIFSLMILRTDVFERFKKLYEVRFNTIIVNQATPSVKLESYTHCHHTYEVIEVGLAWETKLFSARVKGFTK